MSRCSLATMVMIKKLILAGCLLFFIIGKSAAQREDFQLRLATSVSGKTNYKLDWGVVLYKSFHVSGVWFCTSHFCCLMFGCVQVISCV